MLNICHLHKISIQFTKFRYGFILKTNFMQKRQENFFRMAESVREVLNRHKEVWQGTPIFASEQAQFETLVTGLHRSTMFAQAKSTGVTEDKEQLKIKAISSTVHLARRAGVFALNTHNMELYEQLHFTKDLLYHFADKVLVAKMRFVETQLHRYQAELVAYSISPQEQQDFTALVETYAAIQARPRDVIVERKQYNNTGAGLIVQIRQALTKLDSLINIFDGTTFDQEYKSARIVINLGIRHRHEDEDKEQKEQKPS